MTYQKLDTELLKSIERGVSSFVLLNADSVGKEAARLSLLMRCESFRLIDRRLQALLKAKKIVFNSKTGWALVSEL